MRIRFPITLPRIRNPIRFRTLLRWAALGILALILLTVGRDSVQFNPAQVAAASHRFDLVEWQATNVLSKWVHRTVSALPWNSQSKATRRTQVEEYFRLGEQLAALRSDLVRAEAQTGAEAAAAVTRLEAEVAQLKATRNKLRNDVEETLEATISAVIVAEGFASWGELILPPVDIRLTSPPKLLVTSTRDRVQRIHDVLLDSNVRLSQRTTIEDELLKNSNLAALVIDIGGLATYPASLPSDQSMQRTLRIAAHEWLHHHLFFRPLGQSMFESGDMQTLNETVATIAGREIGDRAFEMLGGTLDPGATADEQTAGNESQEEEKEGFYFNTEMHKTRLRVDELLAEGRIERAESYMEERRVLFVENRFFIRKLNQAYFAFNGTYAVNPASVSPIGDQLREFRDLVLDLGDFLGKLSRVSSYQDFLDDLAELKSRAGEP